MGVLATRATTMAVRPGIHTHYQFMGFLLMSAFMRPVWGGLDWLFSLINWAKRKVLKDKTLLYTMTSTVDMIQDLCNILVDSNFQVCKLIKGGGFNESNLYNHFKNTTKVIKKFSKIIEPHGSLSAELNNSLPEPSTDEMPPVKWTPDRPELIKRIDKYEKNYRKQVHQEIINLRAAHPDYLQLDGENDELIMKSICVKTVNNGKKVGEIEDNLRELRAAHPDYLQLDGENDELIKRFTKYSIKMRQNITNIFI